MSSRRGKAKSEKAFCHQRCHKRRSSLRPPSSRPTNKMSLNNTSPTSILATAAAGGAPPSLLKQVGMAGTAAVLTVTFIHPIDVVKVRMSVGFFQHSSMLIFLFFEQCP